VDCARHLPNPCSRWWLRNRLLDPLMGSGLVEIGCIVAQYLVQMALAHDTYVIQTLAPHTPKEALRSRIGPRCLDWGAHNSDSRGLGDPGEGGSELGIVVPDQERRFLIVGRGFARLLGDPGVGRMARDAQMYDPTRGVLDHEKGEHRSQEEVGAWEEVARPDAFGLVAEKGRPGLPAWSWPTSAVQLLGYFCPTHRIGKSSRRISGRNNVLAETTRYAEPGCTLAVTDP
jgi:hypothetical protein